jgi:hypothetical protein
MTSKTTNKFSPEAPRPGARCRSGQHAVCRRSPRIGTECVDYRNACRADRDGGLHRPARPALDPPAGRTLARHGSGRPGDHGLRRAVDHRPAHREPGDIEPATALCCLSPDSSYWRLPVDGLLRQWARHRCCCLGPDDHTDRNQCVPANRPYAVSVALSALTAARCRQHRSRDRWLE